MRIYSDCYQTLAESGKFEGQYLKILYYSLLLLVYAGIVFAPIAVLGMVERSLSSNDYTFYIGILLLLYFMYVIVRWSSTHKVISIDHVFMVGGLSIFILLSYNEVFTTMEV